MKKRLNQTANPKASDAKHKKVKGPEVCSYTQMIQAFQICKAGSNERHKQGKGRADPSRIRLKNNWFR
ncbi:hypothetical protein FOCC_FOCC016013 [Frankliniella occidentalis]|nr:hypothetical protein FOCC_FOCC016013 [Frankliniella occidentalis]